MFKNTLRPMQFLLMSLLYLTNTYAADASYSDWLEEVFSCSFSEAPQISLPELEASRDRAQPSRSLPTQDKQKRKYLVAEHLARLLNSDEQSAQKLLRGLLQFTLLEGYKKLTCDLSYESPIRSYINTIYFNYYFDFPYYLIDQPGNTLADQLENTLQRLNQDFTTQFATQEPDNLGQFKNTFIYLLYILNNLSDLASHIIKLLSNPSDSSLQEEITRRFEDEYTRVRARNALADALKKSFI